MAGAKPGVHVLQLKPVSIPKALLEGDKFVKWEEDSSAGIPCTLKVDPNGFFLYWTYFTDRPETDMLDIITISDTRTNRFAKIPKDSKLKEVVNAFGPQDTPLEQKTLTVVHGTNFVDLSFTNFVTQRPETVKTWVDELLKLAYNLLSLNASPITYLRKTHTKICLIKDKHGRIPLKRILKIFSRHGEDKKRVESALEACNLLNSKSDGISEEELTWEKFMQFYRILTTRVDAQRVFCQLTSQQTASPSSGSRDSLHPMNCEQLVTFLNDVQRDPRLNEILYPYADTARAKEIVTAFEPHPNNVDLGVMSFDGFLNYLLSDENTVISLEQLDLNDDMQQPLGHYFINSSHNTYLVGHQLTGKSSIEMYRQALLAGCRCVELDFWNGKPEEPIIVHGFTLVDPISAKDVIEAVAESAFKTSEYPIILSFENHCNPRQQAKIAQYCKEFFGDMLLEYPLDGFPLDPGFPLPPPSTLRRKIIIKNKKKHRKVVPPSAISAGLMGDSQFHVDLNQTGRLHLPMPPSIDVPSPTPPPQGNGENPRAPMEKEGSGESEEVVNAFPHLVARIVGEVAEAVEEDEDSSSEEEEGSASPDDRRGSQRKRDGEEEVEAGDEISALVNYVQPVHFTSFKEAKKSNKSFQMSSFVETSALNLLKEHPTKFVDYNKRQLARVYPKGTRVDSSNFLPHQFWNAGCQLVALNYQTIDLPMQLNLGIFEYNNRSGYLLKPDFMRRPDRTFDPFAESTVDGIIAGSLSVRIISGQFLSEKRASCYVEVEMYGLPTDTVRKRFRTKTVQNNGMNPVWDEESFRFKKVVLPELATVRIAAYDENSRNILGHRVLPLVGLRPGYKHIVLRNEKGQSLGLPTLFVQIKPNEEGSPTHGTMAVAGQTVPGSSGGDADAAAQDGKKPDSNASRTNNDVPNLGNPHLTPRSNSVKIKPLISTKQCEERQPSADIPPLALETFDPKAEELEKVWEHKSVKERKKKMDKEVKDAEAKQEKKRQSLQQEQDKNRMQLIKKHEKLIKKMSIKGSENSIKKKTPPVANFSSQSQEDQHQSKLSELEEGFRSELLKLQQEHLLLMKKIHEDHHEPLFQLLEKALRLSQQAQLKTLQGLNDAGVEEIKKRQQDYHKEQIKMLTRDTSNKQELERLVAECRMLILIKIPIGVNR